MAGKVKPIPDGYQTVTPYLTVTDGAMALDFYRAAFGARERMRMPAPGGKVGHAEIEIGGHVVMLSSEFPEMGGKSPQTLGGTPVAIMLYVEDVDGVVDRAVKAGATLRNPVQNQFYGDRMGALTDPFGHHWYVATHVEDVAPDELERRAEKAAKEMAAKG